MDSVLVFHTIKARNLNFSVHVPPSHLFHYDSKNMPISFVWCTLRSGSFRSIEKELNEEQQS